MSSYKRRNLLLSMRIVINIVKKKQFSIDSQRQLFSFLLSMLRSFVPKQSANESNENPSHISEITAT